MSYFDLFTLLENPAGDKRLTIVSLNDLLFETSINRLIAKRYLIKTNWHGTHYLRLSEKGKLRAQRWQHNLANLQTQSALRPSPATSSLPSSPSSSEGGGCAPILIIAAVIIGSVIYVVKDRDLLPGLLCFNSAYKKETGIVIEREEVWRQKEGFNSIQIGVLAPNTVLRIVDGPISADGVCWWKVQKRVLAEDMEGWLPEKSKEGELVFKPHKPPK
ncbi:MAG: hypothetical protein ACKVZH_21535 [Blastocatellia bacterium]